MREIKFRSFHSGRGMIYDVHKFWSSHGESFGHVIEDSHHLVMQYTGLRDKNGREIYEGDITQHGIRRSIIEWRDYHSGFVAIAKMHRSVPVEGIEDPIYAELIEVIGNIYENPELLSDSKETC